MLKRPPAIIGVSLTFLFELFGDTLRINLLKNLWGMTSLLTIEQNIGEIFASEVKMIRRHGGIKLLGLIDKLRLIHYIFYLTLFLCFITIPNSVRCKVASNDFIIVEHNGLLQNVNLVSSETQSHTHTISSDGLHNNLEMELESSPLESADDMNLFKQSEQHHRRWHLGKTIYDVRAYGAVGDGSTNDTQAFFTAWKLACGTTNGVVRAPVAYTFLVYPATFKGSKCQPGLQFLVDGTILAPDEVSAWGGVSSPTWLVFEHVTNFSISGTGTFNGQGKNWWACKKTKTCKQAPTAVEIHHGTDVTVENVTFLNSQQIHLNLNSVVRGQAKFVTIVAPPTSPNTDGIHVSACTNTTIQNCNIATGDDCISIVSGSHNIEVENVYCGPGCHGISVGSLGENGATANVSQVQVKNCVMEGTTNGLRIKTWQGGKGLAYNFVYQNISMINVTNPIIIDQYYCPSSQSGPCSNSTDAVQIELVKYTNITGTSLSSTAVSFQCSKSVACTSIYLQDISLQQTSGSPTKSSCTNARGVAIGIEKPPSCLIIDNTRCATILSWLKSTLNNLIGNEQPLLDKNKNNTKLLIYLCIAYMSCLLFATYWVSVLIF